MGLNTKNYNYDEIKDMLDKYFGDFDENDSLISRQKKLYKKLGEFDGNLKDRENLKKQKLNYFTKHVLKEIFLLQLIVVLVVLKLKMNLRILLIRENNGYQFLKNILV